MFWLKVAPQILAVLIAIVVARLDYVTHDRRTREFKSGRLWLLVLLCVSLLINIVVVIEDDNAKTREAKELNDQLNSLKQQVESAQISITGGNNLCYVILDTGGVGGNDSMLDVVNDGDSPLYDVSFRMWDPADYGQDQKPSKSFEEFLARSVNVNVGNLNPHSVKMFGRKRLRDVDSQNFEIAIIARNGSFTERLRLRKVNGVWKRAFRVHSGYMNRDESTVLIEKVDADFPRDGTGKIHWD